MPSLGPAGRGGARRRTRRRMNKRANTTAPATASAPTTASTPATSDPMDKLKKLGELHDAGILTDEEFSAKKADILSKI